MSDLWLPPSARTSDGLIFRCRRCPWQITVQQRLDGVLALEQHSRTHAALPTPLEAQQMKLASEIHREAYGATDEYGKRELPVIAGLTDTEENRRANIIERQDDQPDLSPEADE